MVGEARSPRLGVVRMIGGNALCKEDLEGEGGPLVFGQGIQDGAHGGVEVLLKGTPDGNDPDANVNTLGRLG
jgi:hypothetical protein